MWSEPCVLSVSLTSTSSKKPLRSSCNKWLCRNLFNIFRITILRFSCYHFIIVPPISKTSSSLTRILLTACVYSWRGRSSTYHCSQIFGWFCNFFFVVKLSNVIVTFMFLHVIFYFSSASIWDQWRRWENLLNFFITIQKRKEIFN